MRKNEMNLQDLDIQPPIEKEDYEGILTLPWYGEEHKIPVSFYLDDKDLGPSGKQLQAIKSFIENKNEIFGKLEDQLFTYYKEIREDADGDYDEDYFMEHYPEIRDKKALKNYMQFKSVLVWYYDEDWSSYIGLVIDCDWDIELGVGVKLIKNKVREIDVQDIVI